MLKSLESLFERVVVSDSLQAIRKKAFDRFLEIGLPEKGHGAFQYVPLKSLYEENFSSCEQAVLSREEIEGMIYPESKNSYLVFINGFFESSLSHVSAIPKQVVVLPLGESMRSYGTFLQNRWNKTLDKDTDPFAILNLALHPRGAFIYVPPKVIVESPIQCLFLSTAKDQLSHPRLQLFVSSQSDVKFIASTSGEGFSNGVIDVALEDGARFSYVDTAPLDYKETKGKSFSFLNATLKRNSYLSALTLYPRRDLTRNSFQVTLSGENAEALVQGGWRLKEKEEMHIHVLMKHEAPFCRSMQKFKGVLEDLSQSSFEGKIFVTENAQKTEAYQLNNNLILGEYAVANSKPNLEIFADDVKASHGATVTQLDREELFYLKSRGISDDIAKNLLVQSFTGEILAQVPYASIVEQERALC